MEKTPFCVFFFMEILANYNVKKGIINCQNVYLNSCYMQGGRASEKWIQNRNCRAGGYASVH